MKAQCPLFDYRPMQALAPSTFRITNGRKGTADTPKARGHAFQLTAEEVKVALGVVTSMYSFNFFQLLLCILLIVFLLDNFLVNSLSALMLFDSCASWSFVSQSFNRIFDMTLGQLECPFQVSIANMH